MTGSKRIYIAGHRGLVGSSLARTLEQLGYDPPIVRTRQQLDLTDQRAVGEFMRAERPDVLFLAAARVGGIQANNQYRWDFIFENIAIQTNLLASALETGVERVVFFGSSCIYPKLAPQPIREDYLLTGPLEPTNEPYAIAKIAGLKMVDAANAQHGRRWVSVMPTNLYGPGDHFDLQNSHVLPTMIRKFHEAKAAMKAGRPQPVVLWGTGTALREFLHVDDLGRAAVHLMNSDDTGLYNIGYGSDVTIRQLASMIADVVGYDGPVEWDASKPDGTPRKLLDSARIRSTGWAPTVSLADGLASTYAWYVATHTS